MLCLADEQNTWSCFLNRIFNGWILGDRHALTPLISFLQPIEAFPSLYIVGVS